MNSLRLGKNFTGISRVTAQMQELIFTLSALHQSASLKTFTHRTLKQKKNITPHLIMKLSRHSKATN
jgi:hypothetical protein